MADLFQKEVQKKIRTGIHINEFMPKIETLFGYIYETDL